MEPVIEVKDLVKTYRKATSPAVDHISFEVGAGDMFALLGPNGAGKTTTISILTTTLAKTSGTVRLAGYDLDHEGREARRHIGIVFQTPTLDDALTAEENLRIHSALYGLFPYRPTHRLMPAAYHQRLQELFALVGLDDALLFKKVQTFSGGMRRKLEIVRGLMHRPEVLFLDEPTAGLDAMSRRTLWSHLREIRRAEGTTVFLTTHYLEEAEGADQVCVLRQGRIAMAGTPQELKRRMVRPALLLDAADRPSLRRELTRLGYPYEEVDGGLKVALATPTGQEIIARLTVPLTRMQVLEATLEDAYLGLMAGAHEAVSA
jgi:ABC-2 type transport system ATP-binding protein